ncbi:response regulator [Halocola ammonii]
MITCFLIDDDADDREIFSIALQDLELETELYTAVNGLDGIEKLNGNGDFQPDFVFLDLNMPKLSGKEVLEEFSKMPNCKDMNVIVYSTSTHERDIEETKELGARHFLPKPSRIDDLRESLRFVFQKEPSDYLIHLRAER